MTRRDPEWLAVDFARTSGASEATSAWAAAARARPALRGELRLVARAELPAALEAELDARGAVHPVLHEAGATLVALPEVRVVAGTATGAAAAVRRLVAGARIPADVEERSGQDEEPTTLVLRPRSGRGADALALAEALRGQPGVLTAQARFLRILPDPRP